MTGVAAACALLAPSLAAAQAVTLPGANGVKVGEGRLHASTDLESRYDSAAGLFTTRSHLEPELVWHLRPGVRYELPGNQLDVRAGGQLDLLWYSSWLTPGSGRASRVQGAADLSFIANQGGPLEVRLTDVFARTDRTTNVALAYGALALSNRVTLAVPVRPGAGALELVPELGHAVETYSALASVQASGCTDISCDPSRLAAFDYQNLHAGLDAHWRFLPKTALVLDTDFDQRLYTRSDTPQASVLKAAVGLSGLVTPRLALNVRLGWAQDLGRVGTGTPVGQAELTSPLTPFTLLRAGYQRVLEPAGAMGLYTADRLYADGRTQLGSRFSLSVAGGVDFLGYSGTTGRRDTLGRLEVLPEYQVNPWVRMGVGYLLGSRASAITSPLLNFTRHEGYVRATATY